MFQSKKSKIILFSAIGLAAVAMVGGALLFGGGTVSKEESKEQALTYSVAKEGAVASSTLLAGTISAAEEQYVYYDASKGSIDSIPVKEGDQVTVGQALVQYNVNELQANYDSAVRSRDKIGRQIYDLRTNGQSVSLTGDEATDSKAVSSTQRSVDLQLQDLNDSYADAQAAVDKAQTALNEATVTSTVSGTVVEVNHSVSKSNTSTNQTVVHVVNQGSLQVTGTLSEYDLANISVDQEIKLTSKVYPDQVWTGKMTYISNYPEGGQASQATGTTGSSNSKYPFKAAITSEVGPLKQGFTLNVEVVNTKKQVLVPLSSVVNEDGKDYVWTIVDGKAKKAEVTLGNADAEKQEIASGVAAEEKVITNPNGDLKEGEKVDAHEETVN